MNKFSLYFLILSVIFISACATTSKYEAKEADINNQLSAMKNDQSIEKYAPVALEQASESVEELNRLIADGADNEKVDHQIYLTEKRLAIAKEAAAMGQAESVVEQAALKRNEVLLNKSREQTQMAERKASAASLYAEKMRQKAKELENTVDNLKAEETERGLLLTLDDILFAFDSAELKSGATRTLDNVADFLKQYPERAIMIEGFTDSIGADEYNQQLSKNRAEAVKEALVASDIKPSRIETRGYGEDYPVATNNTQAGRQENRRVEIVISDAENQPVKERKDMASSR